MKGIIFTLINISLSFILLGQSKHSLLTGTVCDTLGNPVEMATIYIFNDGHFKNKELTNESGIFSVLVCLEENDIFIIEASGFILYPTLCTQELIQSRANYFYLIPINNSRFYFDDEFGH